eukprot:1139547-Pelagomonas_calceolata.AAC.10
MPWAGRKASDQRPLRRSVLLMHTASDKRPLRRSVLLMHTAQSAKSCLWIKLVPWARHKAPAILFVDEFDALGAARGAQSSGDESAAIINELLVSVEEGRREHNIV